MSAFENAISVSDELESTLIEGHPQDLPTTEHEDERHHVNSLHTDLIDNDRMNSDRIVAAYGKAKPLLQQAKERAILNNARADYDQSTIRASPISSFKRTALEQEHNRKSEWTGKDDMEEEDNVSNSLKNQVATARERANLNNARDDYQEAPISSFKRTALEQEHNRKSEWTGKDDMEEEDNVSNSLQNEVATKGGGRFNNSKQGTESVDLNNIAAAKQIIATQEQSMSQLEESFDEEDWWVDQRQRQRPVPSCASSFRHEHDVITPANPTKKSSLNALLSNDSQPVKSYSDEEDELSGWWNERPKRPQGYVKHHQPITTTYVTKHEAPKDYGDVVTAEQYTKYVAGKWEKFAKNGGC